MKSLGGWAVAVAAGLMLAACGGGGDDDGSTVDGPSTGADADRSDGGGGGESDGPPGGPDGAPGVDAAPRTEPVPLRWTATVGAAGGTLTVPGVLTLTVPPGALATDTELVVVPSGDAPSATLPLAATYKFSPSGTTFTVPATLAFTLPTAPPAGARIETAADDGASFTDVGGSIVAANTISAAIDHFSLYTPTYPRPVTTPGASPCTVGTPVELFRTFVGAQSAPPSWIAYPIGVGAVFHYVYSTSRDALANVYGEIRSAAGVLAGSSSNLTGNRVHAIAGGHTAVDADGSYVVAYESNDMGSAIWVRRVDTSLAPAGLAIRVSDRGDGNTRERPRIVRVTAGYLVFWEKRGASGSCLEGVHLDASLAASEPFAVSTCGFGVGTALNWEVAASADHTRALLVSGRAVDLLGGAAVFAQVFDAAGNQLFEATPISDRATASLSVAVAPTDGDLTFLAGWTEGSFGALKLRAFDASNGAAWAQFEPPGAGGTRISLTPDGAGVALGYWSSDQATLARLDATGALRELPVSLGTVAGAYDGSPFWVAKAGNAYTITWATLTNVPTPAENYHVAKAGFATCP